MQLYKYKSFYIDFGKEITETFLNTCFSNNFSIACVISKNIVSPFIVKMDPLTQNGKVICVSVFNNIP